MFIAQADEICVRCEQDIPRGAQFDTNQYDEPLCQDCVDFLENQEEY